MNRKHRLIDWLFLLAMLAYGATMGLVQLFSGKGH